jgi:hypothetical protein
MFGPFLDIHPSKTDTNSARGDDDDSVTMFGQFDCSIHNEGDHRQQRLMSLLIDN